MLAALFFLSTPARARPADPARRSEGVLAAAEADYLKGEYSDAQQEAKRLAGAGQLPAALRPRLYLLLARLAAVYEDQSGVTRWLKQLHRVAPDTHLDVYNDPPLLFHEWEKLAGPVAVPAPVAPPAPPEPAAAPAPTVTAKAESPHRSLDWVPYLPLGIGHFDRDQYPTGFGFLALDLMTIYVTMNEVVSERQQKVGGPNLWGLAGPALIVGGYGYELLDLMPLISARDPAGAETARERLSFFPFGVGQAKNGQIGKAIGFGVAQALFLSQAVQQTDANMRALATLAFMISYAYGSYDAWANHVPLSDGKSEATPAFRIGLEPTWVSRDPARHRGAPGGAQLTAAYTLP